MNKRILDRANKVLDIAKEMAKDNCWILSQLEDISLHIDGYAEPGYSNPECGIIALGNWNKVGFTLINGEPNPPKKLACLPEQVGRIFEKLGIEVEWSDEWCFCTDCSKLVRLHPDSYFWQRSFVEKDGELLCRECVLKDPEEHLFSLEGKEELNTLDIDPSDYQYEKVGDYETGWHHDQNDSPNKVVKKLQKAGVTRFLFNQDEQSQFYTKWSAWVHEEEKDLLKGGITGF